MLPASDAVLTTAPPLGMWATACFMPRNTLTALIRNTRSTSAVGADAISASGMKIPALLTEMSIRP